MLQHSFAPRTALAPAILTAAAQSTAIEAMGAFVPPPNKGSIQSCCPSHILTVMLLKAN